jgi:DNA repair protein RecN (Recombination protein N)
MLIELTIQDLVLIEAARLDFESGLNVISGETGAGKSLLIEALEFLLGQRARAGMVRSGAAKAHVDGRFQIEPGDYGSRVARWLGEYLPLALEEEDVGAEHAFELVLTRVVDREGRSRAHVNHRPVTQKILRGLAEQLVEIHGQNDHQKLFEPAEQLELLDTFGGLHDPAHGYREKRHAWLASLEELERLESGEVDHLQRLDLLRFQLTELAEAELGEDEESDLLAEREQLRHAEELVRTLGGFAHQLTEEDPSTLDALRRGEQQLEPWEDRIPAVTTNLQGLREAIGQLEEVARSLDSFVGGIEADPERLDEIEERLDQLAGLKRKYRTDLPGLIARRDEIEIEIAALASDEHSQDAVRTQVIARSREVHEHGRMLAKARSKLLPRLESSVEKGLRELGLGRASFSVESRGGDAAAGWREALARDPAACGPHGLVALEFHLSANPGEPPAPLREIASGGEMARIMLALRGALAVRQSTPTLIFDEIDSGVGGRLGPELGQHLRTLSAHHQILCVTHLPAVAAAAHQHLRVHKTVECGRTRTRVELLGRDERVAEIADMLSGGRQQATAQAEARRLLEVHDAPRAAAKRRAKAKKAAEG